MAAWHAWISVPKDICNIKNRHKGDRERTGGGGVEKKFLGTAYSFFCAARRVGGVRKFFPYTNDQKFYQTKPFQGRNSAR